MNKLIAAFTLVELLIVVAIIALLGAIFILILNPLGQIGKSHDAKRKHELGEFRKVLEDYYNDKQCYPKPSEVCYDATSGTTCHICGSQNGSPQLTPYLSKLPCDPQQPVKSYLYEVDNTSCPTLFRVYTTLTTKTDPVIAQIGCQYGCGPSPNFTYNYVATSSNTGSTPNTNLCSNFASIYVVVGSYCNICGSYQACKSQYPGQPLYTDPGGGGQPGCQTQCIQN